MSLRVLAWSFLAAVAAFALGMMAAMAIAAARYDRAERAHQDQMRQQHEADSVRNLRVAAQQAQDAATIAAQRDTIAARDRAVAHWKAQRRQVDTIALPDTGSVPVAIVKALQESYQAQLAIADSTILAQDRTIAERDKLLTSYDHILVDRTNQLVAATVSAQNWEHLAKTAPKPPKPARLAVMGEMEAASWPDEMVATVRAGLSAQLTKAVALEGGYQQDIDGPRGVFARVRIHGRVL